MRLRRLEVINFRGFPEAAVDLRPTGATFFVGENNAGKSGLLSACDVVANRAPTENWAFDRQGQAQVVATFAVDDDLRAAFFGALGAPQDYWFRTQVAKELRIRFVQNPVDFGWARATIECTQTEGMFLSLAKAERGDKDFGYYVANLVAWFAAQDFSRSPSYAEGNARDTRGDALLTFDRMVTPVLSQALTRWSDNLFHFNSTRAGSPHERPVNSQPRLERNGENLANVLLRIMSHNLREYNEIQHVLADLIPDPGDLQVPVIENKMQVALRRSNGLILPLREVGTGIEQAILAAIVGVTNAPASLVILEEPEANFEAGAQRRLVRHIDNWATNRQFAIATHSTVILDRASRLGESVFLVERRDGKSSVRRVSARESDVLANLGVRMSDVMSASGIALVEGNSEEVAYELWFADELRDANVVVIGMGGGDRAWHAGELEDWIDKASALPIPVRCIRDRDELRDDQIDRLEAGPVHVLNRRELENYFLEPTAVRTVLDQALGNESEDLTGWSDEQALAAMRAASDDLRSLVIVKRVAARAGGLRLLPRDSVLAIVKRLPGRDDEAILQLLVAEAEAALKRIDIRAAYAEEAAKVHARWETDWLSLAPGEEVLASLWRRFGMTYDKSRHTRAFARTLRELNRIPDEIASVIRGLCAEVTQHRGG